MKHFELGKMVGDKVSKTKGMLTHLFINMDLGKQYVYQPKGINPDTGTPVDVIMLEEARVMGGKETETDLPTQVIGSEATDIATGFKGTVVGLTLHINGCLHVEIKPAGTLLSGNTIPTQDFDIRRVKGKLITPLNGTALKKSIEAKPSPSRRIPVTKIPR